jgi:3-oxoacyl-(acyl-carrier-protein) synthase
LSGKSAITDLNVFSPEGYLYKRAGQVPSDMVEALRNKFISLGAADRATLFALEACHEAVAESQLTADDLRTTALITATNFGGIASGESLLATANGVSTPASQHADFQEAQPSYAAELLARQLRLGGPVSVMSLSCSSGTGAIAHAADLIMAGRIKRALVVGYDSISRFAWSGLCALRTMTTDEVRPFDKRRSGTIFSEGAAAVLLEYAEHGVARGATSQVELVGWATGNNGTHMTAPAPQGAGSADVMLRAMQVAGVAPEEIDHFNAHGTSTQLNDATEAAALHTVLGERASLIPTTSNKGSVGHLMGAAGTAEAIASIMSIRHGLVPPTANHEELDPECPLRVVTGQPEQVSLDAVLSNSAGIGGSNAAIVLRSS